MKKCPNCGKEMVESPGWLGLFICPDYVTPTNSAPPFEYKCQGMEITDAGAEAFLDEIERIICERN